MTFEEYVISLKDQYERKNAAYGSSAHDTFKKFGIVSYLTRLSDKMNRMNTLLTNKNISCNDESILDTCGDAATYCIMMYSDMATSYLNGDIKYEDCVYTLFRCFRYHNVCVATDNDYSEKYGNMSCIDVLDDVYETSKTDILNAIRIVKYMIARLLLAGYNYKTSSNATESENV